MTRRLWSVTLVAAALLLMSAAIWPRWERPLRRHAPRQAAARTQRLGARPLPRDAAATVAAAPAGADTQPATPPSAYRNANVPMPPPPAPAHITGTVYSEDGSPCPATVAVMPYGGLAGTVRRIATSPDGKFSVEVAAGEWSLCAETEVALSSAESTDVEAGDSTEVDLYLERAAVVTGRVTDSYGRPLEGAEVDCTDDGDLVASHASTDARGEYRLLVPGWTASIRFRHAGYATAVVELTLEAGEHASRDVTLVAEAVIEGRVVGPSGAPVAGAAVKATPAGQGGLFPPDPATTDAEGRYRIGSFAAGKYVVDVSAQDFPPASRTDVELAPGETKRVDLALSRGGALSGVVRSRASWLPVEGAEVQRVVQADGGWTPTDEESDGTDAEGKFWLDHLASGRIRVRVSHQQFEAQDFEVTIAEGEEAHLEVWLVEGGQISGRAFDPIGRFLAQGWVTATVAGKDEEGGSAETQPDGTFELKGLAPGEYVLTVGADSGDPTREWIGVPKTVRLADGESQRVDLSMEEHAVAPEPPEGTPDAEH